MAGRSLLPGVPKLLQHRAQEMTHQQIADMYGTTRQAVSLKLRGAETAPVSRQLWPWDVQPRHRTSWMYESVLYYLVDTTKQRPLNEREMARVTNFLDMLRRLDGDYVVDYDPDSAPGFILRLRRPDEAPDSILGAPTR